MSFEEFERGTFKEPGTGIYIVDGDTPIENDKKLREFWEALESPGALTLAKTSNGHDAVWSDTQKLELSYCVSHAFGAHRDAVLTAMSDATATWAATANVKYHHVAAEDADCTNSNANVVFDVSPVVGVVDYLARSFFPDSGRGERTVLIDASSFTMAAPGSLTGVLRHELGHTLGFRHEHTRPEAGKCFEDNKWRALTPYDSASVMHYPQCNGTNTFELLLSSMDRQGASALYGVPGGGGGGGGGGGTTSQVTVTGAVNQGQTDAYGPYKAAAGTDFIATQVGTGDADLYVRFGAAPTSTEYHCRPFAKTSKEQCRLTVPAGGSDVYVSVTGHHGHSGYKTDISYTAR